MPYKDSDQAKEAAKERQRKHRQGVTKGVTAEGVTGQGVTGYPAIIHALADPEKRRKLEKVYQSLRDFKQEKNVYYGSPYNGLSFDIIGEMLEATR